MKHFTLACLVLATHSIPPASAQFQPKAGEIYREFSRHNGGNIDWRVTDEQSIVKFPRAQQFLPNPVLTVEVEDLEHATRAEVLLDRWGGHRGTVNKRIRFNDNPWIIVPEISAVPNGMHGQNLMFQDNPVVAVPLEHLKLGENAFEAGCDERDGFGWGQWGIYSIVLRVYYDADQKNEQLAFSAAIVSPRSGDVLLDQPNVTVEAESRNGIARVDFIAAYDGYDEDGDGVFTGWHGSRFQMVRGQPNELRDHVGSCWRLPYTQTWDTRWVPDQRPGTIDFVARVQDSRGYWFITDVVRDLTLLRRDTSVQLYRPRDVPEDFGVRADDKLGCWFEIPPSHALENAEASVLHLRTWNGDDHEHEPLRLNELEMPAHGKNHHYDYDLLPFPTSALRPGRNDFQVHSTTEHHHLEVLWPGPAIVVRYAVDIQGRQVRIDTADYEGREHFVITTRDAMYWLDKNSGGLSRLIDREGRDWIAFRTEPWGDYPAAAAGAFRGIPNLVPNGPDEGFGHPGWDQAVSKQAGEAEIDCTSRSGKWRMRWTFSNEDVMLTVQQTDVDQAYWFLYEGPIAGRWSPNDQYFATDLLEPHSIPHDFQQNDRLYSQWRWAYFGDTTCDRILAIQQATQDDKIDTFSHLGNDADGLKSADGMVVFGFGRGRVGKDPRLTGTNRFRIRLLEQRGVTSQDYRVLKRTLDSELERN